MANRRWFLKGSLAAGSAAFLGCSSGDGDAAAPGTDVVAADSVGSDAAASDTGAPVEDVGGEPDPDVGSPRVDVETPPVCDDPFVGGQMLGLLAWAEEGDRPFETPVNRGWDGRLYTDLSKIEADDLLTSIEAFYIRTFAPPGLADLEPWEVRMTGLVESPISWSMDDLLALEEPMGSLVMECSGNGPLSHFGLLSACEWRGVPLSKLLEQATVTDPSARVRIVGYDAQTIPSDHSTPGADWIFSVDQLVDAGAFLATHMGDEPLTADHGAPIRLMVPNWYGCTCIKWVTDIEWVADDTPSTPQMREFAKRTHQVGIPSLARDYRPATMDQAAMPIRVEQWEVDGETAYRVVGIMWGGYEVTDALEIQFGNGEFVPVDVCPEQTANQPWTLWTHQWTPSSPGTTLIRLRVADANVPTIRLDSGFYDRYTIVPA